MSDEFRTPTEELRHLLEQIAEVKTTLRDVAGRLAQIEQHVKRAFRLPPRVASPASVPRGPRTPLPPPTLSPSEALRLFDELPPLMEHEGRDGIERRLKDLDVPDLRLMVHELGAPLPGKPSRRALIAAIMGRANESLLLSRNRNVSTPRSSSQGTGTTNEGQ